MVLVRKPASATEGGELTDGAQTIAGDKTFSGDTTVSGTLDAAGGFAGTGGLATTTVPGLVTKSVVSSVYMATTMSGIADGANPTIIFDNADDDIDGIWNAGTNSFEPTIAGWYHVIVSAFTVGGSLAAHITSSIQTNLVNGRSISCSTGEQDANGNKVHNGSKLIYFNGTTDAMSVNASMDTTGATWSIALGQNQTFFNIFLVKPD